MLDEMYLPYQLAGRVKSAVIVLFVDGLYWICVGVNTLPSLMKTRLLFNKDFYKSVTSFSSIWMTSTTVSLIDLPTVLSTRSAWSGSS